MGLLSQELNEFVRGNMVVKGAFEKIISGGEALMRAVVALETIAESLQNVEKLLLRGNAHLGDIARELRQTTDEDRINAGPEGDAPPTLGDVLVQLKNSVDDI